MIDLIACIGTLLMSIGFAIGLLTAVEICVNVSYGYNSAALKHQLKKMVIAVLLFVSGLPFFVYSLEAMV